MLSAVHYAPMPAAGPPSLPLILASGSPRRTELLTRLGVLHEVKPTDAPEDDLQSTPQATVLLLARRKVQAAAIVDPGRRILAADTVVSIDEHILGKPRDEQENRKFIERLSGRWHEVYTGLALALNGQVFTAFEVTRVKFRALSFAEVIGYARSGEGLDKAGGYGIQEKGMALVERLDGDYFNVVGLPIARLVTLAREANIELLPWAAPGEL